MSILIPAIFRRGARFAGGSILDAATDASRAALVESAEVLFEYVDHVARVYSEAPTSRRATAPLTKDQRLAERIGFPIEELRGAVATAAARGRSGEIEAADFLSELMLGRSPRLASQIRARVYSPLDGDHAELARTLDLSIKNNFEKGPTAAALPVHRNTLRDRIASISELTGVALQSVEGRGRAWLAWLARVSG